MEGIGNTPLLTIPGEGCRLFAKLESRNLAGSVKDRAAAGMLRDGERRGLLRPGGTVIEATSGNTGIALAALAATRGYRCVITMPEDASRERRALMEAYGAQVVLSPAAEGMAGAVKRAKALAAETPGAFLADQFGNPANPLAHYETTGPEIWQQTGGKVDLFVAGVGTGGTVTGVGRYLKERKAVQVLGVLPVVGEQIPGIGAGFTPPVLDKNVVDVWVYVTAAQARDAGRRLARSCGILIGPSGAAALHAAWAAAEKFPDKNVVTLFPDLAERYLSTGWLDTLHGGNGHAGVPTDWQ